MKTTLNKIREHSPFPSFLTKLLKHLNKTQADDEPLPLITILNSNGLDDALWCLRAVDGYEKEMRLYAVWCARQVQHLTRDRRSIALLDVAERHAHGKATTEELAMAGAIAESAVKAAKAAVAAAKAAADAADAAVRDLAWGSKGFASWVTAWAAAWAAGTSMAAAEAAAKRTAKRTAKHAAWDAEDAVGRVPAWNAVWDATMATAWDAARRASCSAAWAAVRGAEWDTTRCVAMAAQENELRRVLAEIEAARGIKDQS